MALTTSTNLYNTQQDLLQTNFSMPTNIRNWGLDKSAFNPKKVARYSSLKRGKEEVPLGERLKCFMVQTTRSLLSSLFFDNRHQSLYSLIIIILMRNFYCNLEYHFKDDVTVNNVVANDLIRETFT
uniref:Uncharacterized protein n=1 Tax=Strigamia maritima TaxID=126957 RepID=T1JLZ9_STRMM